MDYTKYSDARFNEDGTCWYYDGHVNVESDCTCDRNLIEQYDLWEFTHSFHVSFFNNTCRCKCGNTLGQQTVDEGKYYQYGMGGKCYQCV